MDVAAQTCELIMRMSQLWKQLQVTLGLHQQYIYAARRNFLVFDIVYDFLPF